MQAEVTAVKVDDEQRALGLYRDQRIIHTVGQNHIMLCQVVDRNAGLVIVQRHRLANTSCRPGRLRSE